MRIPVLTIGLFLGAATAAAQQPDTLRIETVPVAPGVSMLVGRGGNIAVAAGDDGVFLVDDQFAPLNPRILEAVRALSSRPVRFLVNTHWHWDHTGGNEGLGNAGVVIVAHQNVRQRMSVEQFVARFNARVPPSPKAALPVVTFADAVAFHLNGDDIHAVHVRNAHTDGDALVHWAKADVIHMGDTFFNGFYPFIDTGSGGSIDGMIAAVDAALKYVGDRTRIIPGHGPLAGRADLLAYREMLVATRDAVARLVREGRTREQVVAAKPTASFDEKWGKGFMNPETYVGILFDSLAPKK